MWFPFLLFWKRCLSISDNEWRWVLKSRVSRHRLYFALSLQCITCSRDVFFDKCSSKIDFISLSSLVYPLYFKESPQQISLISLSLGRLWRPISFLFPTVFSFHIIDVVLVLHRRHRSSSLLDSLRYYWSLYFTEYRSWFSFNLFFL